MKLGEFLQNPEFKQKFILEKLIQEFCGLTREEIRTNTDKEITEEQKETLINAYKSYLIDKKPLEYVVGHVDFFERSFFVDENTLIPRPETEYMITAINEFMQEKKEKKSDFQLFDIGTGCGVLGISVLLENPEYFKNIIFCDISEGALKVAEKNYQNLVKTSYNHQFLKSDLADFIKDTEINDESIILVANLPYIPDETFDHNALENVQKREPRIAFVGGDDGLNLYRRMFHQIEEQINTQKFQKHQITMFLEMMTRQTDLLRKEFQTMNFEEVKTFHFNIRIVKATRN